jgi:hypothetical protein
MFGLDSPAGASAGALNRRGKGEERRESREEGGGGGQRRANTPGATVGPLLNSRRSRRSEVTSSSRSAFSNKRKRRERKADGSSAGLRLIPSALLSSLPPGKAVWRLNRQSCPTTANAAIRCRTKVFVQRGDECCYEGLRPLSPLSYLLPPPPPISHLPSPPPPTSHLPSPTPPLASQGNRDAHPALAGASGSAAVPLIQSSDSARSFCVLCGHTACRFP